jgi:hypothetical protein
MSLSLQVLEVTEMNVTKSKESKGLHMPCLKMAGCGHGYSIPLPLT